MRYGMRELDYITVKGFKSIASIEKLELGAMTVLIGPNGSGKSNFIDDLGADFDQKRFVPYVVMHEFEGLLFSDAKGFARAILRPKLSSKFQAIRDEFATPEEINDSPETAPSNRVEDLIPGYQKPLMGVLAAQEIGIDTIRRECPLFSGWLEELEQRAD